MFLKELRLPEIQPDGVLPQDDSFMAKPAINLAKYKAAAGKQTILLDYSRAEVNEMQILKQADVVMLELHAAGAVLSGIVSCRSAIL
ncbi:hypothetical protein ACLB1M_11880 [Escherichia coli]